MPQLELGDLSTEQGRVFAAYKLFAIMAWPREESKRKEHLAARASKALSERKGWQYEILFDDSGGHSTIHEALPYSRTIEIARKSIRQWFTTDYIMRTLYRLAAADEIAVEASLNKAAYLTCRRREIGNEHFRSCFPTNETDIKAVWRRQKPASHLCTAFMQWNRWHSTTHDPFHELVFNDLTAVLSFALSLQLWAEKFILPRTRHPLLKHEEIWSVAGIPGVEAGPLIGSPLNEWEIEMLKEYQAPIPAR